MSFNPAMGALRGPHAQRKDATMPPEARLITAAPELLTQLRIAADWMQEMINDIGGCDHGAGICCCADVAKLEMIRAAIAKATGQAV